jgi:osmotically-inducible protein OsmY
MGKMLADLDLEWSTALLMELTAALISDPPAALTVVEIRDEAGTVTLSGEVGSREVRKRLEQITNQHPGVLGTINDLDVPASQASAQGRATFEG